VQSIPIGSIILTVRLDASQFIVTQNGRKPRQEALPSRNREQALREILSQVRGLTPQQESHETLSGFFIQVEQGRAIVSTDKLDHTGLATVSGDNVGIGDEVAVLYKTSMPIVLRATAGGDEYGFVCGYLGFGMMHGEMVRSDRWVQSKEYRIIK